MRAPVPDIPAPPFPAGLPWVNVAMLRMDKLRGAPVLVEFWDFCRVNSLRTLPYLAEWHRRYRAAGLRVIGVHVAGFPPSQDPEAVRAACGRLGVEHAVIVDLEGDIWTAYGNEGWPARYLWTAEGFLDSYHYGEGAYAETEREIQALLGVEREVMAPERPEDAPGVLLPAQTADQPGAYSGPYEAGGVWAVVSGPGTLVVNGERVEAEATGCVRLIEHAHHTAGTLALAGEDGLEVHATCFTPGVP